MAKIGVVGKREKILCFLAAGFHIYESENLNGVFEAVKKAEEDDCVIIFISSDFSDAVPELIENYLDKTVPAVIPLPEYESAIGDGLLSGYVERAVGADIL